jgi:MvdD-like protein with pre-ATP grasp domain
MILILSSSADIHAKHIANLLRQRGREVVCVSREEFGNGASLSLCPEAQRGSITIDGTRIVSDDISAVWYRRPGRVRAASVITDELDRSFTENEWAQILDGFFVVASRRNVSSPWKQRAATKPLQLSIASRVGLRVPKTLFTSDPAEALAFAAEYEGAIVHKAMTAPSNQFVDTRVWSSAERANHRGSPPLSDHISVTNPRSRRCARHDRGPSNLLREHFDGQRRCLWIPASIPTQSVARISFPAM